MSVVFFPVKLRCTISLQLYELGETNDGGTPILSFTVPRSESGGVVNNKREVFSFKFNEVFDQSAKQDQVFLSVARPVVEKWV